MRNRSGFGWLELVIGIVLIVLGIFTFVNPGTALTGFVVVYGAIAVVMGIADIMLYVRTERYTGFGPVVSLIAGILSVMSGVMLLIYPDAGKFVLSLLFPIWFIAHCISRLFQLHLIRITTGSGIYYFTMIVSIIGLILGFMMLFRPVLTLLSASYIAGIYLILLGIDGIVMAFSSVGSR